MIKGDIEMPEYQRSFVWDEEMSTNMIQNLKNKFFVPPVIIGQYQTDTGKKNLILDGQQRLTSLLLAKLGVFPDKAKFASTLKKLMDENDDPVDNDENYTAICDWTYTKLTQGKKKIEEIEAAIDRALYKDVNYKIGGDFFNENYLGFCYLVPKTTEETPQQKYYSTLFRSINAQGVALIPQESRESLYFLDATKSFFFKPSFIDTINIKGSKGITHIDYARYLALIANYKKEGAFNKIAVGCKKDFESFYEDYIQAVVDETDSPKFGHYPTLFGTGVLETRLESLKHHIQELKLSEKTYNSIIYLDIDFFGLIYYVLFEGREVDFTKKVQLQTQLNLKAKHFKDDTKHSKSPASVIYLRERVKESILTYKRYLL